MSLVMDEDPLSPFMASPLGSDISTGYLEDALLEFSETSKRRRLLISGDPESNQFNHLAKSYWNSNCNWDLDEENISWMNQISGGDGFSDEPRSTSMSEEENMNVPDEIKTAEVEAISAVETVDSSSSSYKHYSSDTLPTKFPLSSSSSSGIGLMGMRNVGSDEMMKMRKKRVIRKVVYPFALVKPGGIEGDMTLKEINERILMPPTRPVKHPVGDFACRPCVSAHGPGLSGKAVVALTRIHTQGRGTITIIRTKG